MLFRSLEDIDEDASLIRLPNKMIISRIHIENNPDYKDIINNADCYELLDDETMVLMLFIMTECKKKTKSWFWPYFKSIQKIEDLSDYDPTYIKETEDPTLNEYVKSRDDSIIH